MRVLHPQGWAPPIGYANGIEAKGRIVFVAGQVGWDAQQKFQSEELAPQFEQALKNVLAVLAEVAGAQAESAAVRRPVAMMRNDVPVAVETTLEMAWYPYGVRHLVAQAAYFGLDADPRLSAHYAEAQRALAEQRATLAERVAAKGLSLMPPQE